MSHITSTKMEITDKQSLREGLASEFPGFEIAEDTVVQNYNGTSSTNVDIRLAPKGVDEKTARRTGIGFKKNKDGVFEVSTDWWQLNRSEHFKALAKEARENNTSLNNRVLGKVNCGYTEAQANQFALQRGYVCHSTSMQNVNGVKQRQIVIQTH